MTNVTADGRASALTVQFHAAIGAEVRFERRASYEIDVAFADHLLGEEDVAFIMGEEIDVDATADAGIGPDRDDAHRVFRPIGADPVGERRAADRLGGGGRTPAGGGGLGFAGRPDP